MNASAAPASRPWPKERVRQRSSMRLWSIRCASSSAMTATKLIWKPGRSEACGSSAMSRMATHAKSACGVKCSPASAAMPATMPIMAARVAEMSGCTASAKSTAPTSSRIERPRWRRRNQRPSQSRPPARIATLNPLIATRCVSPVVAKSASAGAAPSRSVPITMQARIERDSRSGHGALAARRARPVAARARQRMAASHSPGDDGRAGRHPVAGMIIVPADPLTDLAVASAPPKALGGFHQVMVSITSPGCGIEARAARRATWSSTGVANSNSRLTGRRMGWPLIERSSPPCTGSPCFQRDLLARGSPMAMVARVKMPSTGSWPIVSRHRSRSTWANWRPTAAATKTIEAWSARRALEATSGANGSWWSTMYTKEAIDSAATPTPPSNHGAHDCVHPQARPQPQPSHKPHATVSGRHSSRWTSIKPHHHMECGTHPRAHLFSSGATRTRLRAAATIVCVNARLGRGGRCSRR